MMAMAELPEVAEIHGAAGDTCVLLKVRTAGPVYADDAGRAAHEASPEYRTARDVTRTLLAGPPDVSPVIPVAGKGLYRTGA